MSKLSVVQLEQRSPAAPQALTSLPLRQVPSLPQHPVGHVDALQAVPPPPCPPCSGSRLDRPQPTIMRRSKTTAEHATTARRRTRRGDSTTKEVSMLQPLTGQRSKRAPGPVASETHLPAGQFSNQAVVDFEVDACASVLLADAEGERCGRKVRALRAEF